jgi:hypothetical protein
MILTGKSFRYGTALPYLWAAFGNHYLKISRQRHAAAVQTRTYIPVLCKHQGNRLSALYS